MEVVEKVLDIPVIDMTDGSAEGRGAELKAPTAEAAAQKKRGRPRGSRNKKPSTRTSPTQTKRSTKPVATAKTATAMDSNEIESSARDLLANVEALTKAVQAQGREVAELRRKLAR